MSFINHAYEKLKSQVSVVLTKNKILKTANATLLEICGTTSKEATAPDFGKTNRSDTLGTQTY